MFEFQNILKITLDVFNVDNTFKDCHNGSMDKKIPIQTIAIVTCLKNNGPQYVDVLASRLGSPTAAFQTRLRHRLKCLEGEGVVFSYQGDGYGKLWAIAPRAAAPAKLIPFPQPVTVNLKRAA